MNKQELIRRAVERLSDVKDFDTERAHSEADETLCDVLTSLGYEEIVEAWRKVDKWYA